MSMMDYGVSDYGLVLNWNIMNVLAAKVFEDYSDQDWEVDKWAFAMDLCDRLGIEYISEFTGESKFLTDEGYGEYNKWDYYSGDIIFYVPVSNRSTLFKTAYKDMDELINEFKDKTGEYLPDNFDYRNNICEIVGTYYG